MHTARDIKQFGYPQLQLEAALVQLNSLEEGIPLQEIVDKLSALEQKFDTAELTAPQQQFSTSEMDPPDRRAISRQLPPPTHQETPISTASDLPTDAADAQSRTQAAISTASDLKTPNPSSTPQGSQNLEDLPLFWEALKSKFPMKLRYGLLDGAVPTVKGTNTVEIACSHLSMVTHEDKKIVTDLLTQEVGTPVKIELVASDTVRESTSAPDATKKTEQKTSMVRKAEAEDDPQLKPALELFEATVLETQ